MVVGDNASLAPDAVFHLALRHNINGRLGRAIHDGAGNHGVLTVYYHRAHKPSALKKK